MGTGGSYPYIFKVKTNGKSAKTLKKGIRPVVYNGNIYYIKCDFDENDDYYGERNLGIYRMSLSGKNDKCIKKSDAIEDFAVYKSKIYYTKSNDYGYYLYNVSTSGGKSKVMFYDTDIYPSDIKIYSDYIYFNYGYDIYKIKINSTKKTKVVSNAALRDVSGGYVYYIVDGYDSQSLYKIKISNKSKTFIKKQELSIGKVTVDGEYMIMTLYNYPNEYSQNNAAEYLCNTNGKNGKILKRYFVS